MVEADLRYSFQLGSIFVSKILENNEIKCIFLFCVLKITTTWPPNLAHSAMGACNLKLINCSHTDLFIIKCYPALRSLWDLQGFEVVVDLNSFEPKDSPIHHNPLQKYPQNILKCTAEIVIIES